MAGVTLLGIGLLLLLGAASYYAFGVLAKSNLDELTYATDRPSVVEVVEPSSPEAAVSAPPRQARDSSNALSTRAEAQPDSKVARVESSSVTTVETEGGQPGALTKSPVPASQQHGEVAAAITAEGETEAAGGGDVPKPVQRVGGNDGGGDAPQPVPSEGANAGGGDAVSQETDAVAAYSLNDTDEYTALKGAQLDPYQREDGASSGFSYSPFDELQAEAALYSPPRSFDSIGQPGPPTLIRIPAISVDSQVNELGVVLLSDSYAWETPDQVVGHIPTTASPGGQGHGWYFGHLESPIKGEGSVFRLLPRIVSYLNADLAVYIFLEDADRKYMYQVYKTEVVHQDELRITDSGEQDITLVTCVPRLYYDHRLLVTAALVGVRES